MPLLALGSYRTAGCIHPTCHSLPLVQTVFWDRHFCDQLHMTIGLCTGWCSSLHFHPLHCQTSLHRGGRTGAAYANHYSLVGCPSCWILSLSLTDYWLPQCRKPHSFFQLSCPGYPMCLCLPGSSWKGRMNFGVFLFLLSHCYSPKLWLGAPALGSFVPPCPILPSPV